MLPWDENLNSCFWMASSLQSIRCDNPCSEEMQLPSVKWNVYEFNHAKLFIPHTLTVLVSIPSMMLNRRTLLRRHAYIQISEKNHANNGEYMNAHSSISLMSPTMNRLRTISFATTKSFSSTECASPLPERRQRVILSYLLVCILPRSWLTIDFLYEKVLVEVMIGGPFC